MAALISLAPFDDDGQLRAVIETPKNSRNKFEFDPPTGTIHLKKVLPAGHVFPFDFGFVPQTLAEDGDPLDVLVIMDEPVFPGCVVAARLLGVFEASQIERSGKKVRNDRIVAVVDVEDHSHLRSISDLNEQLLNEIGYFFVSYNSLVGKKVKILKRAGVNRAHTLVQQAIQRYRRKSRR
jgi:inorganic pyrophosphatase